MLVDGIMPPQSCLYPNPRTFDYGPYIEKRNLRM